VDVVLGVCIGLGLAASAWAALRLVSGPRRVLSPEGQAMQAALHAATATLPHLRRGLSRDSAQEAIGHLRALLQAPAVALADREAIPRSTVSGPSTTTAATPSEHSSAQAATSACTSRRTYSAASRCVRCRRRSSRRSS
jgi:LytS/YehU family sensor histidine kinase